MYFSRNLIQSRNPNHLNQSTSAHSMYFSVCVHICREGTPPELEKTDVAQTQNSGSSNTLTETIKQTRGNKEVHFHRELQMTNDRRMPAPGFRVDRSNHCPSEVGGANNFFKNPNSKQKP